MKKQNVKKDDYELYSFPMPFLLKRSRRKNYITKKLEQLHPCFSDNCCYDAKYKLQKGKLIAAVAVMDKLKLAEYRTGKQKHSSLKFGEVNKLEFFNNEKLLNISLALGIALLTGILFISYILHTKKNSKIQTQKVTVSKEIKQVDAEGLIQENIAQAYNSLEDFLKTTKEVGGSIKNCSLFFLQNQNTDESYKMHLSMSNCFPQDFLKETENVKSKRMFCSAVTYTNSTPEFSATLEGKATKGLQFEYQLSKPQINDIRLCVWNCNGILITDFSDEGTVEFLSPNISLPKLLKNLENVCTKHSIFPSAIEIEGGAVNTNIKIIFAKKILSKKYNPLVLLERYNDILFKQTLPKKNAQKNKVVIQKNNASTNSFKEERESFGKIIQKDGSILVFYKNGQGKIIGEKK